MRSPRRLPLIDDAQQVLVLYGDVPLLRVETLRALREQAGGEDLALLTAELADAIGLRPHRARSARSDAPHRRGRRCQRARAAYPRNQHRRAGGPGGAAAPLARFV